MYTGLNSRAGDLRTVKFKYATQFAGGVGVVERIANVMRVVLHSDRSLEIQDTGVRFFD